MPIKTKSQRLRTSTCTSTNAHTLCTQHYTIDSRTHLRLCKSTCSDMTSMVLTGASGMCESSTLELEAGSGDVLPWYVLNENCGPIHRRRCGPMCVIISTCHDDDDDAVSLATTTRDSGLADATCRCTSYECSQIFGYYWQKIIESTSKT